MTIDEKRHIDIKEALRARGLTFALIARQEQVAKSTISIVSRGYRKSRRLERAIAQALNVEPAELWPERYKA